HLRRRGRRGARPPVARPAPGGALGRRHPARAPCRPRHARRSVPVRQAAVLLHRPVRPRHEYVGHADASEIDEVVIRGDREARVLTALWISDNRVLAAMHTNDWDASDLIRAVVGREATAAIRDTTVPLADALG